MREAASIWRERVDAWRASGLSQKAFCRDKSYSYQGLQRWAVRLAPRRPDTVGLARVVPPGSSGVTLEVGGARVVVDSTTDLELLGKVLATLRATG
jgi:hypothetical protein